MKKFYSILSIAIAFSMLALTTSCSDDDEDINKTEVLTTKKWTLTKEEIEFQGERTDITDQDDCEKDDFFTFATDGSYKNEIGTDDCDGWQETSSGKWSWDDGEKTLVINDEEFTLAGISSSQLVLKQIDEGTSVEINGKIEYAYNVYTFTGK